MFSEILKDLRANNHLSQGQLAKAVGVSPGNVSDWESGKTKPGYSALSALARYFQVSADYLLELQFQLSEDQDFLSNYKNEHGLICDDSPLEDDEADLVAMYRLLPVNVREDFFDQLHCLYQKYAERKRASIYWTYAADKEESGPAEGDSSHGGTA